MSFVAIDIGASDTRYVSEHGKINTLANNMVFMDVNKEVNLQPYGSNIDGALELIIESEKPNEMFPIKALIGQLASRHSPTCEKPTVMANKHMQQINYVSVIAAAALAKHEYGLDDNLDLYIAVPPIEINSANKKFNEILTGNYTVTFPKYNDMKISFNINSLKCYEESFLAILSYFFDMQGTLKEKASSFATGNVLSLDIGASTTDLAIVQNMKFLERTGKTYKIGGNIAREKLSDLIRDTEGYDMTQEQAEKVISEGRVQLGNKYKDVSELVIEAKKFFAEQVISQIQNYFRTVNIPLQDIRAIIVSGGGSMHSEYVDEEGKKIITSEPMSSYITAALKKVCDGVEVVPYEETPRLANIQGLYIRSSLDFKKKAAK